MSDPRQDAPIVRLVTAAQVTESERGFTGVIGAKVKSNLGFRVAGKIVERLVNVGQQVKAGQPLMRIDETDLRLALTAKRNVVAVLFCSSDQFAQGVLIEATARGLSVPKDVAVIGFGDQEIAASTEPALTSVHIGRQMLGQVAAKALVDRFAASPLWPWFMMWGLNLSGGVLHNANTGGSAVPVSVRIIGDASICLIEADPPR